MNLIQAYLNDPVAIGWTVFLLFLWLIYFGIKRFLLCIAAMFLFLVPAEVRAEDVPPFISNIPLKNNPMTNNPATNNPMTNNPMTNNPMTNNPFTRYDLSDPDSTWRGGRDKHMRGYESPRW